MNNTDRICFLLRIHTRKIFWILCSLALLLSSCSRQRAVAPPPSAESGSRSEQVFTTNEEAVKAGVYEQFEDSLALKGQPSVTVGKSVSPVPENPAPDSSPSGVTMGWRIQLGAFADQESAEALAGRIREQAGSSRKVYVRYYAPMWKVHAGDCTTRQEAEALKTFFQGLGYPDAWVVSAGISR